jgi:dihydrofolate synthase
LSEARSYFNLAVANELFGFVTKEEWEGMVETSRVFMDERALDSYYNILFSTVLFWRVHGTWPETLTVVSHGFKRTRIVDGHCAAVGFPLERVRFMGINPPGMDGEGQVNWEKANAMKGVQLAMGQWEEDPHGMGEELAGKRRARNCWGADQRLFLADEERQKSGVVTVMLEDGTEALTEGIAQLKGR